MKGRLTGWEDLYKRWLPSQSPCRSLRTLALSHSADCQLSPGRLVTRGLSPALHDSHHLPDHKTIGFKVRIAAIQALLCTRPHAEHFSIFVQLNSHSR